MAEAYKAILTEALKIETYTQPIDIALKGKLARIILNISASQARYVIEKKTKRIRQ
jgi:hypothetical protein